MHKFSVIVFCLLATGVFAQKKEVDSLFNVLHTQQADSDKANTYRSIAGYYRDNNYKLAVEYYTKAITILKTLQKPLVLANTYYSVGYCFLNDGDFAKSLDNYFQAASIYTKLNDSFRLVNTYMSVANVYSDEHDYAKEDEYLNKTKIYIDDMHDSTLLCNFFDEKGIGFNQRQLYDSALFYHQKASAIAALLTDNYTKISCLSNLGLTYFHMHNTAKAMACFSNAMEISIKEKMPADVVANLYNNIAVTQAGAGNYNDAENDFFKSISSAEESGVKNIILENYRNIADMYGERKDYKQQVLYLKKYYSLKDSLFTSDTKNQLTELEANYQIEQKNAQLQTEKGEVQKQKGERNLFLIIALSAAILLTVSIIFYSRSKRTNLLLIEKNNQIEKQKQKVESTLSELKSTQAQLIQSEKMASLGELTAGIAHEIQNPLNFVNNFSEVSIEMLDEMNAELEKGKIEEAKLISNEIKQNLDKINHHGKRADAIVKGMLQHSRKSTGQKEPTDINGLCDEYLRLSYHGLRAKDKSFNSGLVTEFDENIGKINIIPQDIGRVFINLFNNAFYAVNEKKKKGDDSYKPLVSVQTKKKNGKIEIIVKDNGDGIPQTVIDKIFQPFFTTKPTGEGTGLGLSLSYDIITKQHNGSIEVASEKNYYTQFTITLPA